MLEFDYFDGSDFITFNIIETNRNCNEITLAVSHLGKISVITYELLTDKNGLYFEYGPLFDKIYLKNFEVINE